VVCGSNGGNPVVPNGYPNLVATGEANVEVEGNEPACVRGVPGRAERDACWSLLVAAYPHFTSYQELAARRLPMGLLTPAEGPEADSRPAVSGRGADDVVDVP
jgi:hypothetical protein